MQKLLTNLYPYHRIHTVYFMGLFPGISLPVCFGPSRSFCACLLCAQIQDTLLYLLTLSFRSEMASICGNDTRVWYANSTRTSIGCYDGTGLNVISPRMSAEQGDQEWYHKAFPSGKSIKSPASLCKLNKTRKMAHGLRPFRQA